MKKIKDPVVERVVNKFVQRSNVGVEKYNTTLEDANLDKKTWLNHLQEELMDAVLYLQKLKETIKQDGREPKETN